MSPDRAEIGRIAGKLLLGEIPWVDGMAPPGAINLLIGPYGPLSLVGHTVTKTTGSHGGINVRAAVKSSYVLTGVVLPGNDLSEYFVWLWTLAEVLAKALPDVSDADPPQVLTDQLAPIQATGQATASQPLILAIVLKWRQRG